MIAIIFRHRRFVTNRQYERSFFMAPVNPSSSPSFNIKSIYNTLAKKTNAPKKEYDPNNYNDYFGKDISFSLQGKPKHKKGATSFSFNQNNEKNYHRMGPRYILNDDSVKKKGDKVHYFALPSEQGMTKDKPRISYEIITENKDNDNKRGSKVGDIVKVYKKEIKCSQDYDHCVPDEPKVTELKPQEIAELYKKMEQEAKSNESGNSFVYEALDPKTY